MDCQHSALCYYRFAVAIHGTVIQMTTRFTRRQVTRDRMESEVLACDWHYASHEHCQFARAGA